MTSARTTPWACRSSTASDFPQSDVSLGKAIERSPFLVKGRSLSALLLHKQQPYRHEQGCNQRADDKAVHPEQGQSSNRRDQDQIIRQAQVLANQLRPQQVIDGTFGLSAPCSGRTPSPGWNMRRCFIVFSHERSKEKGGYSAHGHSLSCSLQNLPVPSKSTR